MAITASKLAISGTYENIFAKILVIATGQQVNPMDMNDLDSLYVQHGNYASIAQLVETHMNQKVANNGGDLVKTVSQAMANATGDAASWTTAKTVSFMGDIDKIGVNTWTGLFEHVIGNRTTVHGAQLDLHVKQLVQAYAIPTTPTIPNSGVDSFKLPADFAAQFTDPQLGDINSRIVSRDANGNVVKEYNFDMPNMLTTATARFFDFANGDHTLGFTESMYQAMFGYGKDTYLLNFSAGDRIVILDSNAGLNNGPTTFYNQIRSVFDSYVDPRTPGVSDWELGSNLVALQTARQPLGDLVVFPTKGVPQGLAEFTTDNPIVKGINYALNFQGGDFMPDGQVIIVGINPTFLTPDNFIVNNPAYSL